MAQHSNITDELYDKLSAVNLVPYTAVESEVKDIIEGVLVTLGVVGDEEWTPAGVEPSDDESSDYTSSYDMVSSAESMTSSSEEDSDDDLRFGC